VKWAVPWAAPKAGWTVTNSVGTLAASSVAQKAAHWAELWAARKAALSAVHWVVQLDDLRAAPRVGLTVVHLAEMRAELSVVLRAVHWDNCLVAQMVEYWAERWAGPMGVNSAAHSGSSQAAQRERQTAGWRAERWAGSWDNCLAVTTVGRLVA